MELIQDGRSLATSETGLVRSIRGGNEIEQAMNTGLALNKQPDNQELRKSLRYVIAMMGLREDSIPGDLEKHVLFENIVKSYGFLTPEEIKIAYSMALNGDLFDYQTNKRLNVQLYGDVYSFEHFALVVKAYIEQKRREVVAAINAKANKPKEMAEEEKETSRINFIKKCIIQPIKTHLESKQPLNFGYVNPRKVYCSMKKAGLIDLKREDIQKIKARHSNEVKKEWKKKSQSPAKTKQDHDFKKIVQKALDGTDKTPMHREILKRCHMEAIQAVVDFNDLEEIESKFLTKNL